MTVQMSHFFLEQMLNIKVHAKDQKKSHKISQRNQTAFISRYLTERKDNL